jgi:hypothetical protein
MNHTTRPTPQSVQSLLDDYDQQRANKPPFRSEKIRFTGVEPLDVYNITAPVEDEGRTFILARVEERSTEFSTLCFFEDRGTSYHISEAHPRFEGLQDPCVTKIGSEWIVGGVEWPIENPADPDDPIFRMKFYRGKNLKSLQFFYEGPDNMKDIRFVDLLENGIGLFTRPHEGIGPDGLPVPRGLIGFTVLGSLDELTNEVVMNAPLYRHQFVAPLEWGGVNEAHLLGNGKIGILGHIAQDEPRGETIIKHYYPMTFCIDPATREASAIKMIARRSDFPAGPPKRDQLKNVVFSGGIVRLPENKAVLYAGLSDAEAGLIGIEDPFVHYEG